MPSPIRRLADRLSAGVIVVLICAGTAGPAGAQSGPRAPDRAVTDTTRQVEERPSPRSTASASPDTVYVASGDFWTGTLEAQVRQRALFRQMQSEENAASRSGNRSGNEAASSGASSSVSIGGLVINDTRTTIGSDFYDVFYGRWETPKGAGNVTVRVREQPRPNLGTRIVVEVAGKTVFRANLRPRFEQIKQAARAALARTHRYIQKRYDPRTRY
jgi:hypothetical protein